MKRPTEGAPSSVSRALRLPAAFLGKLARVGLGALRQFFADNCSQHAAAIAYRVLFSIAPLAIVLVSIFGLVLQDDSVRDDVVHTIVDALPVSPSGTKDVEDAITAIATPASAVGLLSLLVFAWAATGMMAAIRQGLESAMGVDESRPLARGKVVDLLLIFGSGGPRAPDRWAHSPGTISWRGASEPLASATGLGAGHGSKRSPSPGRLRCPSGS